MKTTPSPTSDSLRSSGRSWSWLGLGLVLLGPIVYAVQLRLKLLSVPWHAAALATAGVAFLLLALRRRRTIWGSAALILAGLLAAGEWYFLIVKSKLPAYAGPVAVGVPFPAFCTTLADGSAFDQESLRGRQNTALVFFRGRW